MLKILRAALKGMHGPEIPERQSSGETGSGDTGQVRIGSALCMLR